MRQVTILRLRQTLPRTISYHRVKLASTGNRFLRSWTHVPPGRPSWRQLGRTYLDFQRTDSNPQCGDSKSSQTDCFAGPGTGPDLLSTPPHQRIQDDQSKDSADRQEQWLHDVKRFARRSVRYSKNLRHVVVTRSTLQQQRCILSHILTLQQTACARMVGSEWGFEAILGLSLRTCANFGSNQRLSVIFLPPSLLELLCEGTGRGSM